MAGGNEKLYVQNINCDGYFTPVIEIKNADNSFTLFPNPATEQLYLTSDNAFRNMQVEISDFEGKVLTKGQYEGKEIIFDISLYKKGVYLIHLYCSGINEYMKFVKI